MKNYDDSKFVKRFFVNCEQKFKDLSIHSWIYAVKTCFVDKTVEWISQQSEIQDIFDLEKFDEKNKQRFIALIRQKYSDRKSSIHKQWMIQFKKFKQNEKKSLKQYYVRIHEILRNFDDQNIEKNDDAFSRLEFIVLNQIIEKFVNKLTDRQFRIKLNYKYMIEISFETQNLYDVYLIVKEYSNRIANKKKTLKNEFEKKLSIVLQTHNMTIALQFVMKNQSESYTRKSKSIFVDRIERYRSQQHKKSENTMQKKIVKKKLTQSYVDENSLNSNVSILNKIFEKSQTTSHSDISISKNVITLFSQSQSSYDFVSNELVIRLEKSVERKKSIENYVSDSRKWFAFTMLFEIFSVNEFSLILEKVSCSLFEINTSVNITNIDLFARFIVSELAISTNL